MYERRSYTVHIDIRYILQNINFTQHKIYQLNLSKFYFKEFENTRNNKMNLLMMYLYKNEVYMYYKSQTFKDF